ncbi:MAG: hypothetical protein QW039_04585 [Fervidicoccaceae archaeon]
MAKRSISSILVAIAMTLIILGMFTAIYSKLEFSTNALREKTQSSISMATVLALRNGDRNYEVIIYNYGDRIIEKMTIAYSNGTAIEYENVSSIKPKSLVTLVVSGIPIFYMDAAGETGRIEVVN